MTSESTFFHNAQGTSDDVSPLGGSWLDYHGTLTGTSPGVCCRVGCPNASEVGAHVVGPRDYLLGLAILFDNVPNGIVPLCKSCNNVSYAQFELKPGTKVAPLGLSNAELTAIKGAALYRIYARRLCQLPLSR